MKATASLSLPRPMAVAGIGQVAKLTLLPAILLAAIVVSTAFGSVSIPLSETVGIILKHLGLPVAHTWSSVDVDIVWNLRLPEVLTAVLVGAALSVAGAIFQAVLRNPLADPFVIGTSSGAALGVVIAFVASLSFAWLGFGAVQIMAFAGAMGAVALVYFLARVGRRTPALTFLLAGFAVSTLMVAAMWLVAYQGGSSGRLLNWTMGGLNEPPAWNQLALLGPIMVGLVFGSLVYVRDLNALLLGEEQAAYLGLHTERSKLVLITMAALLTALAVSVAGIIGFVGLVVPHVARLLYGPNHRTLLLASAFLGAAYLALADLGARTLEGGGGELPLGILTAVIGAPFLLVLLRRSGDAYRF